MADEEEELQEELSEGQGEGGEEVIKDFPLTKEIAGESLSLLCKTGSGMAHAYVRMDLRDKAFTDISAISIFVHVRYVDISGNYLGDISALGALTHLLTIKADNNRLTSAKLGELEYLQVANFANNRITSTEGIAHPMLEVLNLSSNNITELAGLTQETLPSLRVLDLHGNQLTTTIGIQTPSLEKLYLASNQLSKMEGLEALRKLTTLHVRENNIATCDGFTPSMEALQYINFRATAVADLTELKKLKCLPFLRALVLAECPVCELDDYRLEALVVLPQLERLDKDLFTEDERAEAEEVAQQRREAEAEGGGGGGES